MNYLFLNVKAKYPMMLLSLTLWFLLSFGLYYAASFGLTAMSVGRTRMAGTKVPKLGFEPREKMGK